MAIRKIISGGQTGADRAALDAAIETGVFHGGRVPKGRLAEDGRIPETYELEEMPTDSYQARTEQNVIDADGTVVISHGKLTDGSKLTQDLAARHGKPCLHIDVEQIPQFLAATKIHEWVLEKGIETLNVAGSRASGDSKIYEDTKHIIGTALLLNTIAVDPRGHIRDHAGGDFAERLPAPPKTVDDAVDQLISRMSLRDRVTIANMGIDELVGLQKSLGRYIGETFRLSHNEELIGSCQDIATELVTDEDQAVAVIIGVLRQELYKSHRLRLIK